MEWRASARCDTSHDCIGREECRVNARCDCPFSDGFANPPACDQFTSETTVVILVNLLEIVVAMIAMVASAATLTKVVQTHPKGFFLSCSILCVLSAATGVAANVVYLIFVSAAGNVWPYEQHHQTQINAFMIILHATPYICATLNLGLMWMEFVIASQRAQQVASNLRMTASYLYVFTVLWLVISCVLLVVTLLIDTFYFSFWVLLTTVAYVVCTVLYIAGGRAMCDVFDRATRRSVASASSNMVASPSFAAAELRKAQRMRLRSRTTRRSYRLNAWCCSTYILTSVVWSALYAFELSHTALWLINCVLRCSVYLSLCTMCFWLNVCVRVEESASGLHTDSFEQTRRSTSRLSLARGLAACRRGVQEAPRQSMETAVGEQSTETMQSAMQPVSLEQVQQSTLAEQQSLPTRPVQPTQPTPPTQPTQLRPPAQGLVQEHSVRPAQPAQQVTPASLVRAVSPVERDDSAHSTQPAEVAQPAPPAELPPPLPSRACMLAHRHRSHRGAGGASTSSVDEQGAIAPQPPARSGPSIAENDVRVCIASGLVSYAGGPHSTPSNGELQGGRASSWREDLYDA